MAWLVTNVYPLTFSQNKCIYTSFQYCKSWGFLIIFNQFQISCSLTCIYLQNARIILDDYEVILHSADSIASVGILHPRAFHLQHKPDSSDRIGDGSVTQEISSCVYEVDEVITHTDMEEKQTLSPGVDAYTNTDLCISKTGKNLRSIGCWIQDRSRASEGAYSHPSISLTLICLLLT
jgi:hypothetical protein